MNYKYLLLTKEISILQLLFQEQLFAQQMSNKNVEFDCKPCRIPRPGANMYKENTSVGEQSRTLQSVLLRQNLSKRLVAKLTMPISLTMLDQ